MRFLLDTNAVLTVLVQKSEPSISRVLVRSEGEIAIPTFESHELYFGAY